MTFIEYFKENFLKTFHILLKKQKSYSLENKYYTEYISFKEFDNQKEKIFHDLLDNLNKKQYFPSDLHPILIPKSDNSLRLICISSIQDKIIQKLILKYIREHHEDKYKISTKADFSSRKTEGGALRARVQALSYRNTYSHILKTDISSFFDNLDRNKIKENIVNYLQIPEIDFILNKIVDMDIRLPPKNSSGLTHEQYKLLSSKQGKGIRQGMPIASFISSLYLYEFDNFLQIRNINYVRYADDLIISCSSHNEAKSIYKDIIKELKKLHLDIPSLEDETKTKIVQNASIDFLGLDFEYTGSSFKSIIPLRVFNKVEEKLDAYDTLNKNIKSKRNFFDVIQELNYIRNGYNSAFSDAANINDLINLIDQEKVLIISKLLGSIGINVNNLSIRKKKFFFDL